METEQTIRCPRRHCPDPKEGWGLVKKRSREHLGEYLCFSCKKRFFYSINLRKAYVGSLKYFLFVDKFVGDEAYSFVEKLKKAAGLVSVNRARCADIIIVLGGDGTMLRATHKYAVLGKTLLGFYFHPSRGFLSNSVSEFDGEIIRYESYGIFYAPLLEVSMRMANGKLKTGVALNEASVKGAASTQTVKLQVSVDDEILLEELMSDGLIISTPLGSTGYAVPAGGSAILPSLAAFEIVPNNSSKPRHRTSQIVSDKSAIRVRALDLPRRKIVVACDNDVFINVSEIEIRRSNMPVKLALIKPDHMSWDQFFLARSREKIYD